MDLPDINGKKALLVIAPSNFRDEEYFETRKVLEESGAAVTTASKSAGHVKGMLGRTATAELALDDVTAPDYDAVVFIGGNGAQAYFDDSRAIEIAVKAFEAGRVVAAICIAPVILANAGILNGKRATCYDGEFASKLEAGGAEYTAESIARDDMIITADGPASARDFGAEIVKALAEP
jgi:protease I